MAPIPVVQKKQRTLTAQTTTANVVNELGETLEYTLSKQKRTNRNHDSRITTNSQHAQQFESDINKNTLIYRDVFPGRKYKLTLSDTTWMGGTNVVTIGWTLGDTFTQISSTATAPEDNIFDVEMPSEPAIDTLEVRLIGASDTVRGYLEDTTTTSSIKAAIIEILDKIADLISGQESLEGDIEQLQQDVNSLDQRVTALEQE